MTDRQVRKRTLVVLALVTAAGTGLGLAGYLRGAPPAAPGRFYLRSDGGAVLFEHARHGEAADGCVQCHHELAGDAYACSECHDDPDYAPDSFEHAELLSIHGRACDGCHGIAPSSEATSCRECHQDDLSAVYHRSCSACHLATAPERFADETGGPLCRSCHLR